MIRRSFLKNGVALGAFSVIKPYSFLQAGENPKLQVGVSGGSGLKKSTLSKQKKLVLFTDWYSVWPGNIGYDANGNGHDNEVPRGVRLAVQEAELSASVMQADRPWESELGGYACVLKVESGFKMWYMATEIIRNTKTRNFDPMAGSFEGTKRQHYICYAESDDGFIWRKPDLGLYMHAGSTANNIILPDEHGGLGSIFLDSDGAYRMLIQGAPISGGHSIWSAMRSLTSRDGLHWIFDDIPLYDLFCDTQNVGFYDELLKKYVCYCRYARGSRRAVGMMEGAVLSEMTHPQIVFEPDTEDGPSLDIYTPAYSRHPQFITAERRKMFDKMGRDEDVQRHIDDRDMHFMFPSMYYRDLDVLNIHIAVSRDGRQWSRPERKAIIPNKGICNSLYATPGIHVLNDGLWGIFYSVSNKLHNMGFVSTDESSFSTYYHWATWKENRLIALQADDEGMCTVTLHGRAMKEICFNYATEPNGWIRAELITYKGLWPPSGPTSISGFTFSDCDLIAGDSLSQLVTWNGNSSLPQTSNEDDTVLRLHMFRAKLFSIEWE